FEQRSQDHADDAEHDGAKEGGPETGDVEPRHEKRGKLEHQGVDDEPKDPECHYRQRQGDNLQNESDSGIDQSNDDGRYESRAQPIELDTLKKVGDYGQAGRANRPMD